MDAMTVTDPADPAFVEARRAELAERVGPRRYQHSLGVADTARELARTYGVDGKAAYLAGLLHDWDKGYDDPGILARADELGLDLPEELRAMPRVLHGMTAAVALAREFPALDPAVLQAIARHTVGEKAMTPLDKVVYIADALEPGRSGKTVERLRARVGEAALDELFLDVYAYWVRLILERRHPLYSRTTEIWNSYMPAQEVFRAAPGADPMPYGRP